MIIGEIVWLGLLAIVLAWEIWAALFRPGWTLTRVLRDRFNVRTETGVVIWLGGWMILAIVFATHVAFGWPV